MTRLCIQHDHQYQTWWTNFSNAVVDATQQLGLTDYLGVAQHMLSEYKSTLCGSMVEFESEEDLTLFLLRWS